MKYLFMKYFIYITTCKIIAERVFRFQTFLDRIKIYQNLGMHIKETFNYIPLLQEGVLIIKKISDISKKDGFKLFQLIF